MTFFRLDKTAQTVLLFASLVTSACQHGSSDGAVPLSTEQAKPRIGYGLVNAWHLQEPGPLAQALDDAGLGLTAIEWAPAWGSPKDPHCSDGSTSQTYPELAKAFVEAMRRHGVATNIIVVNANGCAQRRQGADYVANAVEFIEHEIGTVLVTVTVVSEPWADPENARDWTELGASLWSGDLVMPDAGANHRTGRPFFPGIPYKLLDVHYCDERALLGDLTVPRPDVLHNTDCGPIINPGSVRAAILAGVAAAGGDPFLIYDYRGTSPDFQTIAAMGEAIRPRLTMLRH